MSHIIQGVPYRFTLTIEGECQGPPDSGAGEGSAVVRAMLTEKMMFTPGFFAMVLPNGYSLKAVPALDMYGKADIPGRKS